MAVPDAKISNLKVRPLQSVDLCFEVDGIIGVQGALATLGAPVKAFDFDTFYKNLLIPQSMSSPARLKYDSETIRTELQPNVLFALRAEAARASVDKAIASRENAFYQKYVAKSTIAAKMKEYYDPANADAKFNRLEALAKASKNEHDKLATSYGSDLPDVVKTAVSDDMQYKADGSTPAGRSHTESRGFEYRHPILENDAQYHRAQISLQDERLAQFVFQQNLQQLETIVFPNELTMIDLGVKQLQVAYLNTILLAPINGLVTGLFRDVGDSVKAGQPVMRVENDVEVLLVGTIQWRGMISVGSKVSVTTTVSGVAASTKTMSGKVVSIRGHDSADDQWDLLVRCSNRDSGNQPIFPLNYSFDFDDTTVSIS